MRYQPIFAALFLWPAIATPAYANMNDASAPITPIEIVLPQSILMQTNSQPASALESAASPHVAVPQVANALENSDEDISDDDLTTIRGGEALLIGSQTLVALSQGNTIIGDYNAGDVNLSDNALSGFNGIGNVVINTGAQASLQAGLNLIINVIP